LKNKKEKDSITFSVNYLTAEPTMILLCIKRSAQIGFLCLNILALMLPERFEISGLDKKLNLLSTRL